jgi:hypothetical protein
LNTAQFFASAGHKQFAGNHLAYDKTRTKSLSQLAKWQVCDARHGSKKDPVWQLYRSNTDGFRGLAVLKLVGLMRHCAQKKVSQKNAYGVGKLV